MTDFSYILFNQTPEQLRRIGARGGKAQARNRRLRVKAQTSELTQPQATLSLSTSTVAEAIAELDAQFPWLCGAEKRKTRR